VPVARLAAAQAAIADLKK